MGYYLPSFFFHDAAPPPLPTASPWHGHIETFLPFLSARAYASPARLFLHSLCLRLTINAVNCGLTNRATLLRRFMDGHSFLS